VRSGTFSGAVDRVAFRVDSGSSRIVSL
jgi:hypothetical protein